MPGSPLQRPYKELNMTDFNALRQETDEIIQNLLDDGSDPDALYIIEHHVCLLYTSDAADE